ncbi:unnamed protein product [Adineta ricciae]|uniref:Translin-associated factor X-interacting protein 1 N-terminal domain-containing protein n=1 Tax=Adineta ricciae TaxID=249248 RepID=A0A814R863_ADIRI|nr:unnamed protein product [Adineta ricciae]
MDLDLTDVEINDHVPLTSRDRYFFNELNRFMTDESAKVGKTPSKERFAVYRLAFEKIIDKSALYRPLFRAIKQEYERCIGVLESGAEEVYTMTGDLHRLVLQPKTFLLHQQRCMELEDKLSIIEQDNRRLEAELADMVNQTKLNELQVPKPTNENSSSFPELYTGRRRIPGLTLAEQTDLKTLEKYYEFIRDKSSELDHNASTKYTTKEKQREMQALFEEKLAELDKEREHRLTLRNRLRLYHLIWRTIKKYAEKETGNSMLLEDLIKKAVYESTNIFQKVGQEEDEDEYNSEFLYDREAGILVEHIEIFLNMIESGNYKEASYVAACSPKGVLRNMETLLRFKALKKPVNEDASPWLFHCKVLAETALEAPIKPDLLISLECAKAACHENQLNLLYKWIAEDRLTYSLEMAQLLERLQAFDLAEFIYRKLGAHVDVASCLLQTGNCQHFDYLSYATYPIGSSKRCLDYLIANANSIPNMKDTLTELFHQHPSIKFAIDIVKNAPMTYLQGDELVLLFLQLDQHFNAIQFVEQLMQEKEVVCEIEKEKLQRCFDILQKYSYLAEDKTPTPKIEEEEEEEELKGSETEAELVHRLTRRITRSALNRLRRARRRSSTNSIVLEPIQENPTSLRPSPHPSPSSPSLSSSSPRPSLCHQDFFNDFSNKLYFTHDVELEKDDLNETNI